MKPRDFDQLLENALNGTLTPEEEQRLQEILQTCEPCRKEWEEARRLHDLLRQAPRVPVPLGLRARILQQVRTRHRQQPRRRWVPALAPVFLALLVLLGGLWMLRPTPRPLEATPVTVDLLAPEPDAALLASDFLVVGALYPPMPYELEVQVDSVPVPFRNTGGEGYFILKDLPVSPGYHQITVVVHLPTLKKRLEFHREVYLVASGGDPS